LGTSCHPGVQERQRRVGGGRRAGFIADAKDVSGNNVPVTGGNSMVRQIQW